MKRKLSEPFEAILFDMDGVIIDSEPICRTVIAAMLKDRGHVVSVELQNQYVGRKTSEMWADFITTFDLAEPVSALTAQSDNQYLELIKHSEMQPISGLIPLLDYFQSLNKKMIVASSATAYNIHLVLDKFALSHYFEGHVSSDEVKQAKPNPDIFLLAAKKLGVNPTDCLVIEDSRNGILAARAAGMSSVGYQNPHSGNQDLQLADAVVHSLSEIIALVN
ncbi:HAD family phosphatase [Reichenbachiella agarivorans]|uniref:HAD family phosphatase n=1 Tax=Reichenbachiella agarivorans TaxID=2979464 RepID=A0ABY6CLB3_9BACT|nr:HAD family phosphatase [Reichenbachiella agarivorans]UXP31312.1 HAD family phosphatase [Reichenbachiella agarivorans]